MQVLVCENRPCRWLASGVGLLCKFRPYRWLASGVGGCYASLDPTDGLLVGWGAAMQV